MPLEFVASVRGNPKLIDSGYYYTKDRTHGDITSWECDCRRVIRCRARIRTNHDSVIARVGHHNHSAADRHLLRRTPKEGAALKSNDQSWDSTPTSSKGIPMHASMLQDHTTGADDDNSGHMLDPIAAAQCIIDESEQHLLRLGFTEAVLGKSPPPVTAMEYSFAADDPSQNSATRLLPDDATSVAQPGLLADEQQPQQHQQQQHMSSTLDSEAKKRKLSPDRPDQPGGAVELNGDGNTGTGEAPKMPSHIPSTAMGQLERPHLVLNPPAPQDAPQQPIRTMSEQKSFARKKIFEHSVRIYQQQQQFRSLQQQHQQQQQQFERPQFPSQPGFFAGMEPSAPGHPAPMFSRGIGPTLPRLPTPVELAATTGQPGVPTTMHQHNTDRKQPQPQSLQKQQDPHSFFGGANENIGGTKAGGRGSRAVRNQKGGSAKANAALPPGSVTLDAIDGLLGRWFGVLMEKFEQHDKTLCALVELLQLTTLASTAPGGGPEDYAQGEGTTEEIYQNTAETMTSDQGGVEDGRFSGTDLELRFQSPERGGMDAEGLVGSQSTNEEGCFGDGVSSEHNLLGVPETENADFLPDAALLNRLTAESAAFEAVATGGKQDVSKGQGDARATSVVDHSLSFILAAQGCDVPTSLGCEVVGVGGASAQAIKGPGGATKQRLTPMATAGQSGESIRRDRGMSGVNERHCAMESGGEQIDGCQTTTGDIEHHSEEQELSMQDESIEGENRNRGMSGVNEQNCLMGNGGEESGSVRAMGDTSSGVERTSTEVKSAMGDTYTECKTPSLEMMSPSGTSTDAFECRIPDIGSNKGLTLKETTGPVPIALECNETIEAGESTGDGCSQGMDRTWDISASEPPVSTAVVVERGTETVKRAGEQVLGGQVAVGAEATGEQGISSRDVCQEADKYSVKLDVPCEEQCKTMEERTVISGADSNGGAGDNGTGGGFNAGCYSSTGESERVESGTGVS